jgi:Raf kinase inhibitor-like YbhB/YbcL family protein
MSIRVTSTAFTNGAAIPAKYTCVGKNISPPLRWSAPPEGTRSIALLCDDPDAPAGDWVHWVLFDLPPATSHLEEGVPPKDVLPDGGRQGTNDFGRVGYGGPCPPPGKPHRYCFQVFALDTVLGLDRKATKKDLLKAMEGHVLAEGSLVGTFRR